MANTYDVGDGIRFSAAFTVSSVATDPTSVVFTLTDPSGNVGTSSPTNSGTGAYYKDVILDEPGAFYGRFDGTGAVVASYESWVFVRKRKADE